MNIKRNIVSKRQNYIDEFRAATEKAKSILDALSEKQLHWNPATGQWSVAQCISHLIVSGSEYLEQIIEAVKNAAARQSKAEDPLRYSLVGKLFINMMEPPVKRKMKNPKSFNPAILNTKDTLIKGFSDVNEDFIAAIQSSQNLDLSRIRITSPVSRFLKFNLADVFAFIAAHERRHLWQAEKVKNSIGFPSN